MLSKRFAALGWLVFGLAWLAYDHHRPWVNFHSEALACFGIIALFAGHLLDHRQPLQAPAVTAWVLAAALMPWIWYFAGIGLFAGDALVCSLYLLALAAAIVVGFSWTRARPPAHGNSGLLAFAVTLTWVGIASAAIGLLQWLDMTEWAGMHLVHSDPGARAMGNLGQPNQLGTLLLASLAALLLLFELGHIGRLALTVGAGFLTLVLVLAQSRASMLGAVVVVGFLLVKAGFLKRLHRTALLGWLLCFALGTAALPRVSELLMLDVIRNTSGLLQTADRIGIWSQTLAGIAQAPWLGYGWNQTPTAHAAGALAVPGTASFSYSHSVVLDLMAWMGIPVGLFVAGLVLAWLWSRMRDANAPTPIIALAALLPLAVHSQVEFPFAYAYCVVLAGLLIGVVEAGRVGTRIVICSKRATGALLLCISVLGVYICHEYFLIEEDFRVVRFENLRIGHTPAEYQVPDAWILSQLSEMLKAARTRPTPGMTATDIERLRKVALRFSWVPLHLRYTYALALNGDPAGAAYQLRVVRSMFGDNYYGAAMHELRELRERYPEVETTLQLL